MAVNRPFVEGLLFEDTHGTIPNNCLRVPQRIRKIPDRFDANIHPGVTRVGKFNRNCFGQDLPTLDGFITVNDLMIGWQQ